MPNITRLAPTFTPNVHSTELASGSMSSIYSLDLKQKEGASIICQMGRCDVVTALTRPAFVAIRNTLNDSLSNPNNRFDSVGRSDLAIRTTLAAAITIGDTSCTVASNTGLAIGDVVALSLAGARIEFFRIFNISGTTITPERPFRLAHSSGDNFCTLADVQTIWVPGGDIYNIRCKNNSGQKICFQVDVITENGYVSA